MAPEDVPEAICRALQAGEDVPGPGDIWLSLGSRSPEAALIASIRQALVSGLDRELVGVRCTQDALVHSAELALGVSIQLAVPPAPEPPTPEEPRFIPRRSVMVIERILRSGTAIRARGDVLVYGDVNAGAQIEATGNIVVLGALRGLAHAGSEGDDSAVVISFELCPTQIRIGRRIAFSPEQKPRRQRNSQPEIAFVRQGEIVLRDYRGRLPL